MKTPIKEVFSYKSLKKEIRKSGMRVPEWLRHHGMLAYKTQLRHNALSIVKLRDIMVALEMPVPYFFAEYQELLAERGYILNQVEGALQRVFNLPDSDDKEVLIKLLTATLETSEFEADNPEPE